MVSEFSGEKITYTYESYRKLVRDLLDNGYEFKSFGESLGAKDIYLRHDVDFSPSKALTLAQIEAELDVQSTYFFLLGSPLYNPLFSEDRAAIEEIVELGHDVGLHFSTHQYWSNEPSQSELEARIGEELSILANLVEPSAAISFHIPPDWVLGRTFDSFLSTYEQELFEDIPYVADSNYRWSRNPPFPDGYPDRIQLLTHPGLWGEDPSSFKQRVLDARYNRFEQISLFLDQQYLD